jgi:hypothetical protein
MTSKEFVIWLKGFVEACHEYAPTPKQWDALKDKLAEVKDDPISSPFPFGVPNSAPFVTLPHITPGPSINPYKPYEVYCGTETTQGTITTTPGVSSITIANPSFGFGVTSTATSLPEGTTVSYTNGKTHNED